MKRVLNLVRNAPGYPRNAVISGLRHLGYGLVSNPHEADLVITWNCYGFGLRAATAARARGARHVVLENGVFRGYYRVERDGDGPLGWWPRGPDVRFDPGLLNLTTVPVLEENRGDAVLLLGQRGGAYSPLSMPRGWPDATVAEVRRRTDRPIVFRPHPEKPRGLLTGNYRHVAVSTAPLLADLRRARVAVTWASSAIVHALIAGVPGIYLGPTAFAAKFLSNTLDDLETVAWPGRVVVDRVLRDLTWSHFTEAELADGTALAHVLSRDRPGD